MPGLPSVVRASPYLKSMVDFHLLDTVEINSPEIQTVGIIVQRISDEVYEVQTSDELNPSLIRVHSLYMSKIEEK